MSYLLPSTAVLPLAVLVSSPTGVTPAPCAGASLRVLFMTRTPGSFWAPHVLGKQALKCDLYSRFLEARAYDHYSACPKESIVPSHSLRTA